MVELQKQTETELVFDTFWGWRVFAVGLALGGVAMFLTAVVWLAQGTPRAEGSIARTGVWIASGLMLVMGLVAITGAVLAWRGRGSLAIYPKQRTYFLRDASVFLVKDSAGTFDDFACVRWAEEDRDVEGIPYRAWAAYLVWKDPARAPYLIGIRPRTPLGALSPKRSRREETILLAERVSQALGLPVVDSTDRAGTP